MDKFRVRKKEYVNKTIRIPKELSLELEAILSEKGISFNQLVIQCCQYALEHFDNDSD